MKIDRLLNEMSDMPDDLVLWQTDNEELLKSDLVALRRVVEAAQILAILALQTDGYIDLREQASVVYSMSEAALAEIKEEG